jgi:FtsZ-binding cell division protein ZapB
MSASGEDAKVRQFEEQIAFLQRELERQKEQIDDLWAELAAAKRHISRLSRRLDDGEAMEP